MLPAIGMPVGGGFPVSPFRLRSGVHSSTMDTRPHQLPPTPLSEPDKRLWRVAAGIPFRVRPAALAEPDLVRYTIRLPAGVIHRGFPRCETNQSCGHGLNPGHPVNGEVGTWFGAFRIPNLVPRSLVNIVGCSSRGRGNCGKLRATSNWASKPVIRSFPSAVRTVEKQLRALASSPPELVVFPRFA